MKIPVGISNRHIHLSKSDKDILFGKGYQFKKRNDLTQPGEYATEDTVIIKTDKYEFPHVRVLGPYRDYTQVEVSRDDAKLLGINPPMRDSGDLAGSEDVWIVGPVGEIYKKECCIEATRHIHCTKSDFPKNNNGDIVKVKFNGKTIDNVHLKMKDSFILELHLDKSDAALYEINNGDIVEIE